MKDSIKILEREVVAARAQQGDADDAVKVQVSIPKSKTLKKKE